MNPNPTENTVGCMTTPRWTWRDKLRCKLFPATPCYVPDAPDDPPEFRDALICRVTVELSFIDRLRVLVSGRLSVETKTITENRIGRHQTASSAYPLPIRLLERRES